MTLISAPSELRFPGELGIAQPSRPSEFPLDAPFQGLFDRAKLTAIPAGHRIVGRGEHDRRLILIQQGEAELVIGEGRDELVVGDVGSGEHIGGCGWLGWTHARRATVRAHGACLVRVLDVGDLEALRISQHPGLTEIESDSLRGLLTHLETARRQLKQLTSGGAIEQTEHIPALLTDNAVLEQLLRDSDVAMVSPPPGSAVPRDAGDGRPPRAWLVLHGQVERYQMRRRGPAIKLRPAVVGELGGFAEALGYLDLSEQAIIGPDATLVMFRAARCQQAMHRCNSDASSLRGAMARTVARRLEHALGRLAARNTPSSCASDALNIDQTMMLGATLQGLPGAI